MEKKKKKKKEAAENEGEEKEWALSLAYSAVQIPLDLFVYITLSLSVSPLLSPSPAFILSRCAVALTQTPTCCNRWTAYKYTDSCNLQIILLLLNRNGTPTALASTTVNYSIQKGREESFLLDGARTKNSHMQDGQKAEGVVQRDIIQHAILNFLSYSKSPNLIILFK